MFRHQTRVVRGRQHAPMVVPDQVQVRDGPGFVSMVPGPDSGPVPDKEQRKPGRFERRSSRS